MSKVIEFDIRNFTKARQLGITQFPYMEYDKIGNVLYCEDSSGFWFKRAYSDDYNHQTYYENSHGTWVKYQYDEYYNVIYHENSEGIWHKYQYDSYGRLIEYINHNYDWWNEEVMNIENPYRDD